jgi:hypothetical protein
MSDCSLVRERPVPRHHREDRPHVAISRNTGEIAHSALLSDHQVVWRTHTYGGHNNLHGAVRIPSNKNGMAPGLVVELLTTA